MVWFVNKVARKFPDKIISTLAYWYTRAAPSNIIAEPNVNIMLCNIESTREKPVFDTDPDFTNDLKDWGKLSQDILIWDYNIQFANPVSPFPICTPLVLTSSFISEIMLELSLCRLLEIKGSSLI